MEGPACLGESMSCCTALCTLPLQNLQMHVLTSDRITAIMEDEEDDRHCLGKHEEPISPGTVEQFKWNTFKVAQKEKVKKLSHPLCLSWEDLGCAYAGLEQVSHAWWTDWEFELEWCKAWHEWENSTNGVICASAYLQEWEVVGHSVHNRTRESIKLQEEGAKTQTLCTSSP